MSSTDSTRGAARRGTWLPGWRWVAVAAVLLLAAVAIRVVLLDQRQMFKDEGAAWLLSSYPVPQLIDYTMQDTYPPLYALVLHAWIGIFGDALVTMRLLSVLVGMGVVLVSWRWGHEALGPRWGLVVLAVVGMSGLALEDAREVQKQVLEVFFVAIAWWMIWRLARPGGARRAPVEAIVLALAVAGQLWTSPMGLPTAALQGLFATAAVVVQRTRGSAFAWLAIAAGCLTFVPWLPVQLGVAFNQQGFWSQVPSPLLIPYAYDTQLVGRGHTRIVPILAGLGLLAVALVGIADLLRGRRTPADRREQDRFLGWTLVAALALIPVAWLYSQVRPVWDVGYFTGILPALAIALVAGGRAIARRVPPRHRARTAMAFAAVVLVVLGLSAVQRLGQRLADEDLTPGAQAYATLAEVARPGDVVVARDARSYFAIAWLVGRRSDPLPLAAPLYGWDAPDIPFYYGQGLLPRDRTVDDDAIAASGGWAGRHPSLAAGGRVLLVDLEADAENTTPFEPLASGDLRELARTSITHAGRTAQVIQLGLP